MLGTVVLKDAVQLLEAGAEEHIPKEDDHFQYAFQDDARPAAQRRGPHDEASQKRGQEGEQKQCQRHADESRAGHHGILHGGGGVFLEPFVQLGLCGFGLPLHGDVGSVHQVFVTLIEVFGHVADAAHQRDFIVPAGRDGVVGQVNAAVRLAHGAADFLRSAHHDALHQGLPADGGAKFFGHKRSLLFKFFHADVPARGGRWAG